MKSKRKSPLKPRPRLTRGRQRDEACFPVPPPRSGLPAGYIRTLQEIKRRIQEERLRIVMAANSAMVRLYWDIGRLIVERQGRAGWGAKVIDRLSTDLRDAFPDMKGVSPRNLKYMRAFSITWPDRSIVQEALAQISWYHNIALMEKLSAPEERLWYARMTFEQGWSHNILELQIAARARERQGKAITNFPATLPPADSDMASQVFKDPYLFDFLGTADPRREQEVEQALVDHIQKFLLELGTGFAFVGRQVLVEAGSQDFYIDLLFYHLKLRCYVAIELKSVAFNPAFVGQLNLYLSAVDDLLRHPDDKPTIGLLLCRAKDKVVVEYALRHMTAPIGVAGWETELVGSLPEHLKSALPTVQEIEAELAMNGATMPAAKRPRSPKPPRARKRPGARSSEARPRKK